MEHVLTAIISAVTASVVLTPIVASVLQKWLGARIEQSIKHEYDVQMESIRQDVAIRNRAALVADLIAEWLSHPEDVTKLNRLTFEAFLWLPQDIADDLGKRLANEPDAPDVRTLIGKVRKHLLGAHDAFDAQQINVFRPRAPTDGGR